MSEGRWEQVPATKVTSSHQLLGTDNVHLRLSTALEERVSNPGGESPTSGRKIVSASIQEALPRYPEQVTLLLVPLKKAKQ